MAGRTGQNRDYIEIFDIHVTIWPNSFKHIFCDSLFVSLHYKTNFRWHTPITSNQNTQSFWILTQFEIECFLSNEYSLYDLWWGLHIHLLVLWWWSVECLQMLRQFMCYDDAISWVGESYRIVGSLVIATTAWWTDLIDIVANHYL